MLIRKILHPPFITQYSQTYCQRILNNFNPRYCSLHQQCFEQHDNIYVTSFYHTSSYFYRSTHHGCYETKKILSLTMDDIFMDLVALFVTMHLWQFLFHQRMEGNIWNLLGHRLCIYLLGFQFYVLDICEKVLRFSYPWQP